MAREFADARQFPVAGDTVEMREDLVSAVDGEAFVGDSMLRVLAVVEDWVWFKEYGRPGRPACTIHAWRERLTKGSGGKLILDGKKLAQGMIEAALRAPSNESLAG
jgi:hypothetical protein